MEQVTNVGDVMLPTSVVELKHLRTRTGQPVRVRCEAVDELVVVETMRTLPGLKVKSVDDGMGTPIDSDSAFEQVRELARLAPALIEAGTSLAGADGDVRPAFTFGSGTGDPRALPGKMLRVEDKVALVEAILRCSGYLPGGPADAGSFPDAGRGGAGDGVGAVSAGEDVGPDAVGSAT